MLKTIDDIVNRLVECYNRTRVIYGSCNKSGILEKGSDVDLLVVKDTNRRLIDRLSEVESLLSG